MNPQVLQAIAAAAGWPARTTLRWHSAAGGDINQAAIAESALGRVFVKTNDASRAAMFEAEADGLAELAACAAVRVPAVLGSGVCAGRAWLALEYLPLQPTDRASAIALGRGLAMQHRTAGAEHGWHRDNTIGSTPQRNTREADWTSFYAERRLRPQFELAFENGHRAALEHSADRLLQSLPSLLSGHEPPASLLHGDLWGGNWAAIEQDGGRVPVIFDPAVYHGDRETDIAMTELFGGFPSCFYGAYNETWPLEPGYRYRRPLYQLYHVLNHLNLFGGGYLSQAQRLIRESLHAA